MFKIVAVLAICVAVSSGFGIQAKSPAVEFLGARLQNPRPCTNPGTGQLKEVRISGCTVQPCVFIPNQAHDFNAVFTAGHAGQSAQLIVHAVVGGLPFEIINSNFAVDTTVGNDYSITMTVTVTAELSGVAFTLRAAVYAKPSDGLHFCREVAARVQ